MEFLESFHKFLSLPASQQDGPAQASKTTVKNYKADISQFIRWYETRYSQKFDPNLINSTVLATFKADSEKNLSQSSLNRHLSSLRKFFHYLKIEGLASKDPFEQMKTASDEALAEADPFRLKDFKNNLYVYNASRLTIKNYLIDIKQFLTWAQEVLGTDQAWNEADKNVFAHIDYHLIEEYKKRLLREGRFSPSSVNRKLSSLRKYFSWAYEEGLIESFKDDFDQVEIKKPEEIDAQISALEVSPPLKKGYSSFPPLRFMQKLALPFSLGFESVLISPLARGLSKFEHLAWSLKGKPVFHRKNPGFKLPFSSATPKRALTDIKNIKKEIYAPAFVSTKYLPVHKRVWFHARYTRPNWYRKYHSYPLTTYFHIAILIIFMSAVGFGFYNAFFVQKQKTTLAVGPVAPPRILSFQGRLTDNSDNPITAATWVRFQIYNDVSASGAAKLWEEVQKVTPDSDGIFSILMGNTGSTCVSFPATGACAIPSTVFTDNNSLYLGVAVEATPELTPRQRLATVAFAANSESLQGMLPITADNTSLPNKVLAFNSSGVLDLGANAPTFQATGAFTITGSSLLITTSSNGNVQIAPNGLGKIDVQKPLQNTTLNNNIPQWAGAVEVDDNFAILATSSGQAAFSINQNSTGYLIAASTSGSTKFTVDASGNVNAFGNLSFNTVTAGTWNGTAIGAQYGGTGLNTSSSTGVPYISGGTWSVDSNYLSTLHGGSGNTFSTGGGTATGGIFYFNGTTFAATAQGGATECLLGGAGTPVFSTCPGGAGSSYWGQSNGLLYPLNSTVDLTIGGQSSTSAKFAILNINSGIPTASLSAGISGGLFLNASGNIDTTAKQSISIGTNASSGSVILGQSGSNFFIEPAIQNDTTTNNGYVQISDKLLVQNSESAGNALAVFNNTGSGDLLTASASGSTQFVIGNSGTIRIAGGQTSDIDTLTGTTLKIGASNATGITIGRSGQNITLPTFTTNGGILYTNGSGQLAQTNVTSSSDCLTGGTTPTFASCAGAAAASIFWNQANGALFAKNQTVDTLFGAQATSSARLVVSGDPSAGTRPVASIAAQTSFAALVVDQKGLGDIFTASSSGLNRFVIKSNGNVGIGTAAPGSLFVVNGPNQANVTIADFQLNNTSVFKVNTTNGLTLTGGSSSNGSIATALVLGLKPGINITSETIPVQINAPTYTITGGYATQRITNFTQPTITAGSALNISTEADTVSIAGAPISAGSATIANSVGLRITAGTSIAAGVTNGYGLYVDAPTGASNNYAAVFATGNVGIGNTAPVGLLDVNGKITGKALAIFNETGNQDIFTASASGTPRFSITNAGGIKLALSEGAATNCLLSGGAGVAASWGSCGGGGGTNYWTSLNGTLYPLDLTNDLLVGGNSTASATFHVYGANPGFQGTLPVASISGNTSFAALVVDNRGSGDLFTASSSGLSRFVIKQSGFVGIGTNTPTSTLNVAVPSGAGVITVDGNSSSVGSSVTITDKLTAGNIYSALLNPSGTAGTNLNTIPLAATISTGGSTTGGIYIVSKATSAPIVFATGGVTLANERMRIDGTGNVGIGTTSPLATLDVRGISGTLSVASISGNTSFAALVANNNSSTGDLFTASSSSIPVFTITRTGGIGLGGASGIGTSSQCLLGGATASWGACVVTTDLYWGSALGSLYPLNSTLDFFIGGQSTAAAKFAVLNVNSGTPIASVSSGLNGTSMFFTADGTLSTTRRQSLTIGNSSTYNTTGNVLINSNGVGNVGIGTSTTNTALTVNGTISLGPLSTGVVPGIVARDLAANYSILGFYPQSGTNVNMSFQVFPRGTGQSGNIAQFSVFGTDGIADSANIEYLTARATGTSFFLGTGADGTGTLRPLILSAGLASGASPTNLNQIYLGTNGNIGIGTASPLSTLDIRANSGTISVASVSGQTSFAALVANNDGVGDLFTASASSQSKFTITRNGGIKLGSSEGSATNCLLSGGAGVAASWGSCGTATTQYWNQTLGALYPANSTVDFLIGGQSTTSAKFAVLNVNSGTPTATISGNFIAMPWTNGTAQTGGLVGIGTTTPTALLDINNRAGFNQATAFNITQANSNNADSTALNITNTANSGTLANGTTRNIRNNQLSLTPTLTAQTTSGATIVGLYNSDATLTLTGVTWGDSGAGGNRPTVNAYGYNSSITGTPVINKTAGSGAAFANLYGVRSDVSPTISITALSAGSSTWNTYAGYFNNTTNTAGDVNLTTTAYGILGASTGNLSTARGTEEHYGGSFSASGTAVNNYGIQVGTVLNGTNNYGLYITGPAAGTTNYSIYSSSAAQSYIAASLGIGNLTPVGKLDLAGAITGKALAIFNETGDQDIFTASASGTPKFSITHAGGIKLGTSEGTATNCLLSGGTAAAATWGSCGSSGFNFWTELAGALSPSTIADDLLIGGSATSSAEFHVYGAGPTQGTNPVASIAAQTSFAALVVDQRGLGDLFTASSAGKSLFTIQGTGNVLLGGNAPSIDTSGGALNIGTNTLATLTLGKAAQTTAFNSTAWTATPTISGLVTASSGLRVSNTLTANSSGVQVDRGTITLSNGANNNIALPANVSYVTATGPTGAYNVSGFANAADGRILVVYFNIAQTLTILHDSANSSAGQRITLPNGDITLAANKPVRAVFIYDQSVGAGVGYWVLYSIIDGVNNGNVNIAAFGGTGFSSYAVGDLLYANTTSTLAKLNVGSATQCLIGGTTPSWGACPGAWTQDTTNLVLYPTGPYTNITDLLLGGSSTPSARFAVLNINPGQANPPTASLSAKSAGSPGAAAAYLTAAGLLATTNMQTLQIGNATTGNINFYSTANSLTSGGALTIAGQATINGNQINGSGADFTINSGAGNLLLNTGGAGKVEASIYYDNSDTSYYLDPAASGLTKTQSLYLLSGIGVNTGGSSVDLKATLDVRGKASFIPAASLSANTKTATLVVNNDDTQGDLLVASASSQTHFRVDNAGDILAKGYFAGLNSTTNTSIRATGTTQGNGNSSSIYFQDSSGATKGRLDTVDSPGTGIDGPLVVPSGTTSIDSIEALLTSGTYSAGSTSVASSITGLNPDDEVLIITTDGSGVGKFEFNYVQNISGTTINLRFPLTNTYVSGTPDFTQIIRVPQYTSVTVLSGGTLTATAYSAFQHFGGVLVFRSQGTVSVSSGGFISMDGSGSRGGTASSIPVGGSKGVAAGGSGVQGDNATNNGNPGGGNGGGNGGGAAGNGGKGGNGNGTSANAGGGGGGCCSGAGAGGEYRGGAVNGGAISGGAGGNGGGLSAGNGGNGGGSATGTTGVKQGNQGSANLSNLLNLGSGGGGGAAGAAGGGGAAGTANAGGNGGNGGNAGGGGPGGGAIFINAPTFTNSGNVSANGTAGNAGNNGVAGDPGTNNATTGAGGGGGGAPGSGGGGGSGGAIWISASTITVGTMNAQGGTGGARGTTGGAGGGLITNSKFGGGSGAGPTAGAIGNGATANGTAGATGNTGNGGAGGNGAIKLDGTNIGTPGTPSTFNAGTYTADVLQGGIASRSAYGTLYIKAINTFDADVAETYIVEDQSLEAANLVALPSPEASSSGLIASQHAYDPNLFGVVSTAPGLLLGSLDPAATQSGRAIALTGRVPLKVITQNGPIKIGDYLTSSDLPGVAMKATHAGIMLGRALTGFDCGGQIDHDYCEGKVTVFVNVGYGDPDPPTFVENVSSTAAKLASLTISKLDDGTYGIRDIFGNFITQTQALASAMIGNLSAGMIHTSELFAGSINSPNITTDVISPLTQNLVIKLASPSGKFEIHNGQNLRVASIDSQGNASLSGNLNVEKSATIAGNLNVGSDASISGTLHAGKIFANEIDGLGQLVSSQLPTSSAGGSIVNNYNNNYYFATPSANASGSANLADLGFDGNYQFASISAQLANFNQINGATATFTQGLMAFGPSSLYDVSVADQLSVGAQLTIADRSINVLGSDLQIQPLRQGGVDFLAGLVKIDLDGNLTVNGNANFAKNVSIQGTLSANILSSLSGGDLTLKIGGDGSSNSALKSISVKNSNDASVFTITSAGNFIASGAGTLTKLNLSAEQEALALSDTVVIATGSAGVATISAHQSEITINNPLVTDKSLIYITPKADVSDVGGLFLMRQVPENPALSGVEGSFTVGVNSITNIKIPFNWIIVN